TFNFAQATEDAIASGAACRVEDAAALGATVAELLKDGVRREAMQAAALSYATAHGGATARVMAFIEGRLR
ncbi:MAG: 3-deoxy-D-manno-octulosonic acid transferase, partial [Betaproteobacteria bacterium]